MDTRFEFTKQVKVLDKTDRGKQTFIDEIADDRRKRPGVRAWLPDYTAPADGLGGSHDDRRAQDKKQHGPQA
jgi:hypothetical protein